MAAAFYLYVSGFHLPFSKILPPSTFSVLLLSFKTFSLAKLLC